MYAEIFHFYAAVVKFITEKTSEVWRLPKCVQCFMSTIELQRINSVQVLKV